MYITMIMKIIVIIVHKSVSINHCVWFMHDRRRGRWGAVAQRWRRRVEFQISGLTGKVYQIPRVVTFSIWVYIIKHTHYSLVYTQVHADLDATCWKTIGKIPKQTQAPDSGSLINLYIDKISTRYNVRGEIIYYIIYIFIYGIQGRATAVAI